MQLIPVMDLKNGHVVHARKGRRDQYQIIKSSLCNGSNPEKFAQIFVEQFSANALYIADLDAISGVGNNLHVIDFLLNRYPELTLYLDAGIELLDENIFQSPNYAPVIGSENYINARKLESFIKKYPGSILSLDFNEKGFIGNKDILNTPIIWPDEIILMNLDRVGSENGLNLERLKQIQKISPESKINFAGGIQNQQDLIILENHSVHGVLLATALHNGSIRAESFKSFHN